MWFIGIRAQCPLGALPTKSQATVTTQPTPVTAGMVPVGATAVYTCATGYRIVSPASTPTSAETTITVTCAATGIFSNTNFQCVRKYIQLVSDWLTQQFS